MNIKIKVAKSLRTVCVLINELSSKNMSLLL